MRTINIGEKKINVPVDFLTSELRHISRNEFFDITGINAITSPGAELCFEENEKIPIKGILPDGSSYSALIHSAGLVAFIVMKAHAMNIRTKSKDAYDIWFCLANYTGNIKGIAESFKPHVKKNSVRAALSLLAGYFGTIDARGPLDVAKEDDSTDSDYREFLQQDAYQRVQALLDNIGLE